MKKKIHTNLKILLINLLKTIFKYNNLLKALNYLNKLLK